MDVSAGPKRRLSAKKLMLFLNDGAEEDSLACLGQKGGQSNQSILKKINPEYSLEGLMLKLKFQYYGDLMWRADSLKKTLMLGKTEGGRRRGWQRMSWLDGITGREFEQALWVGDREAWHAAVHRVAKLDTTEWLNWTDRLDEWGSHVYNDIWDAVVISHLKTFLHSSSYFPHVDYLSEQIVKDSDHRATALTRGCLKGLLLVVRVS